MSNVVIIGGGHAAAEAVTSLRMNDWEGGICLISDETHLPYQRPPLSKAYFNDQISAEKLAIKKMTVYEKTATHLMLGRRAQEIDRTNKVVILDNGDSVVYTKLIIATGTRARKLSIEGADLPCVNYLRTLDDVTRIKEKVRSGTRLLVVGAGYIGLEIAASATKLGAQVTVLEAIDRVLARVTCETMSKFYQDLHRDAGVDIRLSVGVARFEANGQAYRAVLNNGSTVDFDVVIVGIGVLPNVELAEQAGLECNNGIVVNEFTQTNDENVFAIGDCCNHPNLFYDRRVRLESVPNAMEQAKTAASVITGNPKPYSAFPWFWSDQYDVKLQTAGLSEGYTEFVVRGEPKGKKFCIFYLKGNKLIAMDAINSAPDFMKAKQLIQNKCEISTAKLLNLSEPWYD